MTRPVLAAQRREITGKDVARLRRQGILPAVLYGHGEASEAIQVDAKAFEAMSRAAGRHALIDLKVRICERTHQGCCARRPGEPRQANTAPRGLLPRQDDRGDDHGT